MSKIGLKVGETIKVEGGFGDEKRRLKLKMTRLVRYRLLHSIDGCAIEGGQWGGSAGWKRISCTFCCRRPGLLGATERGTTLLTSARRLIWQSVGPVKSLLDGTRRHF